MINPSDKKKSLSREQRKAHRFSMTALHNLSVRIGKPGNIYKLANISLGGMGFFEAIPLLPKNVTIPVEISIASEVFETKFEIIHRVENITGGRFVSPDKVLCEAIENYFDMELAALKVMRVEAKYQFRGSDTATFFKGQNNCEIFIQETSEEIQSFSIIFFGNYIGGNCRGAFWLGERIQDEIHTAPNGVQLFRPLETKDEQMLSKAVRFVDSVGGLNQKQRENILRIISESGKNGEDISEPNAPVSGTEHE